MNPLRLALRNLLYGRPRMSEATLFVATCLFLLDLFAGYVAWERSQLEYRAVVEEGQGHLAIVRETGGFAVAEAARAQRIAESVHGVALVVPHAQAYQALTRQLVVYLSRPEDLESVRPVLRSALRREGLQVQVRSWGEASPAYTSARYNLEIALACLSGAVLVVIAAATTATLSISRIERQRELATLRALGMRRQAVFMLLVFEALSIAGFGAMLSVLMSGSAVWLCSLGGAPLPVEPSAARVLAAAAVVMVVAVLAAIVPAAKAARADVVRGLAG